MSDSTPWRVAVTSGLILGLIVGIPYYGLPFFYDYFEQPAAAGGYGWPRAAIVLGLPLGTLIPLVAGPLLVRHVPPGAGIVWGSVLCAAGVGGFGFTGGSLAAYFGCWALYMAGWTFAGPMAHQILLTRVFERNRGSGMALSSFGISLFGAGSVIFLARPLTAALGYHAALAAMGVALLLAAPLAWMGLPDLRKTHHGAEVAAGQSPFRSRVFWLLITGSTLTAAGIAGIGQHLKLILRERGYTDQSRLDEVFGYTVLLMLGCSALGRFAMAGLADRFPRRPVITAAFLLMMAAMPLLWFVDPNHPPYAFAVLFGLGMSTDTLLVALLAGEMFPPASMARAMAVIVPVNTIGQTWFPFAVGLLWNLSGNYNLPLVVVFVLVLVGRYLLAVAAGRDGWIGESF